MYKRKASNNNLARVAAEGSPAFLVYCCAGVTCPLDGKIYANPSVKKMMTFLCTHFSNAVQILAVVSR